jgi:LEA14-like dessication related protein
VNAAYSLTLSKKVSIFLTCKKEFLVQNNFLRIKHSEAIALMLLGTLFVGGLISKGDSLRSIIFRLDRIHSIEWNNGPSLLISIQAQNPTNQSFTIKSIVGNAYCDGYLIGNAFLFSPFTIEPNSQREFIITIQLSLINTTTQLLDAIENGHFKKEITIDGKFNVDNLVIPIKQTLMVGL